MRRSCTYLSYILRSSPSLSLSPFFPVLFLSFPRTLHLQKPSQRDELSSWNHIVSCRPPSSGRTFSSRCGGAYGFLPRSYSEGERYWTEEEEGEVLHQKRGKGEYWRRRGGNGPRGRRYRTNRGERGKLLDRGGERGTTGPKEGGR